MKKILLILIAVSALCLSINAKDRAYQPKFSTAGFYELPNTGRTVYSMNPAWRFHKGNVVGASAKDFNDTTWKIVNLPNGIQLLPPEASACVNYQGIVWYRKHFKLDPNLKGKELFLYFEAIMGKSKVWINGKLLTEHFGGYLPVIANIAPYVKFGEDNVIAVMADNSDDPLYPPGKPQEALDFTYCGGIYRDCWLVATNKVFITDPNYVNVVGGGGVFVRYSKVSKKSAMIHLYTQVQNDESKTFRGRVYYELVNKEGKIVKKLSKRIKIKAGKRSAITDSCIIKDPHLWSPDDPYLYHLRIYVRKDGQNIDGYYIRIGIKSIEFRGKKGLYINGEPLKYPLIGANRHQDFAIIGNALSNSLHWRDAKKLRDLGLRMIRNAHYPQDPAFMDACDELGLLVIINTPGWQFWNNKPIFAQRVYSDIRNMIRRDRNRASFFFWEPILNESWYPESFVDEALKCVHEEYPGTASACDSFMKGHELFQILYRHPPLGADCDKKYDKTKCYFTREWGDNVDNWSAQNSTSRCSRAWGEVPMLIQAQDYAKPPFQHTCYDDLYKVFHKYPAHFGGALWHPFDHQRGYHPDPFYGGIMDNFRQPKLSYYMFMAQRPAKIDSNLISQTGPMVYIANILSPFSPNDVTVYSNCDSVSLQFCKPGGEGAKLYTYHKDPKYIGMPSPVIVFKNVTNFMLDKKYCRSKRERDYYLLAKGYMNGKLVASDTVHPARRPTNIRLSADSQGNKLVANGSDMMVIVASVCDKFGTVKRLNNQKIKFEISGPAELVCNSKTFTNPRDVQWGTAPIIIRTTTVPGKIVIKASTAWQGKQSPLPGELVLYSIPAQNKFIADSTTLAEHNKAIQLKNSKISKIVVNKSEEKKLQEQLKVVEKQQADFENIK